MKKLLSTLLICVITVLAAFVLTGCEENTYNNTYSDNDIQLIRNGKTLVENTENKVIVRTLDTNKRISSTIYEFSKDVLKRVTMEVDYLYNTTTINDDYATLLKNIADGKTIYEKAEINGGIIKIYYTKQKVEMTGTNKTQEEFFKSMQQLYSNNTVNANDNLSQFYSNIRQVQAVIDEKILLNIAENKDEVYAKWVDIIDGYTKTNASIQILPRFDLTINGVPVALINNSIINNITGLNKEVYDSLYYISKDGKVYTAGYNHNGTVIYN